MCQVDGQRQATGSTERVLFKSNSGIPVQGINK